MKILLNIYALCHLLVMWFSGKHFFRTNHPFCCSKCVHCIPALKGSTSVFYTKAEKDYLKTFFNNKITNISQSITCVPKIIVLPFRGRGLANLKNKLSSKKHIKIKPFYSLSKCLIFTILFSITTLNAQTLNELLQTATNDNLELKILKNEYLTALEIAPQVSQLPNPEVGAGFFPLPVETRLGSQRFRWSVTQMFPWFGLLDSKKELALAQAEPILERLQATALNLHYKLKTAYFKLYELEKSQLILDKNLTVLAALERVALAKLESGKGTAAEVIEIQIQSEAVQQEIAILESMKTAPLVDINQLLQRDLETPVVIEDSLDFVNLVYKEDSLMAQIEAQHPMLRMFTLQQEVSEKALVLNELADKPSFGFGLDYIHVDRRHLANLDNNGRDIVQVRAMVKVPIFKQKYAAKEREEQLKIQTLEDKKTNTLLQFQAQIRKAYAQHEQASLKRNLYLKQMELTKAAIQVLKAAYSAQTSRFDELLQLEKNLLDYELKLLKTMIDSHLAKVKINRFFIF